MNFRSHYYWFVPDLPGFPCEIAVDDTFTDKRCYKVVIKAANQGVISVYVRLETFNAVQDGDYIEYEVNNPLDLYTKLIPLYDAEEQKRKILEAARKRPSGGDPNKVKSG
jgi:hypothetical protein